MLGIVGRSSRKQFATSSIGSGLASGPLTELPLDEPMAEGPNQCRLATSEGLPPLPVSRF